MKTLLALVVSLLLGMRSVPVQESPQLPTLDLLGFWNMLVQLFEQVSSLSGFVREAWVWLMNQLPASTVLWFTLGIFSTVGYALAMMSAKVCKILMVVFWAIFFIFLIKAGLHL